MRVYRNSVKRVLLASGSSVVLGKKCPNVALAEEPMGGSQGRFSATSASRNSPHQPADPAADNGLTGLARALSTVIHIHLILSGLYGVCRCFLYRLPGEIVNLMFCR